MMRQIGRYEILQELGRGSMSIVYKARDPLIDRDIAIKVINLARLPPEKITEYEARLYNEAKSAGRLNHRNIFTIHDVAKSGDVAYIAMEILDGRELRDVIDERMGLSLDESLDIAIQVANGLGHAHRHGVAHHDIKPANIMVLEDNYVKIADFGIAKMAPMLARKTSMAAGSPAYMSPEQVQALPLDTRSDIFSLGVVLYQMLTRCRPFTGSDPYSVMYKIVNTDPAPPSSLNPAVPERLDAIVAKCLAKNAAVRYQSADELATDLRACREMLHVTNTSHYRLLASGSFRHLRRVAIPGGLSQEAVALVGYIMILAIFWADVLNDATVQMHLLYLFPLALIAFHCEGRRVVNTAVMLAIALQAITLNEYGDSLPALSKAILGILILPSNILIAYIASIARANFLEVEQMASFDWLSGLRNRHSFETLIEAEIRRQKEYGNTFSLASIDLDNLKQLNSSNGAAAGDEALKVVAQTLREHIRQSDTAARLGGDDFAVLMPHTGADECAQLCAHLSALINAELGRALIPVTASMAHVAFDLPPSSVSRALEQASHAMRDAKTRAGTATVTGQYGLGAVPEL